MIIQLLSIRISEENAVLAVQWYNPANGVVSNATEDGIIDYMVKGGKAIICNGEKIEPVSFANEQHGTARLYLASAGVHLPLPLPHI